MTALLVRKHSLVGHLIEYQINLLDELVCMFCVQHFVSFLCLILLAICFVVDVRGGNA